MQMQRVNPTGFSMIRNHIRIFSEGNITVTYIRRCTRSIYLWSSIVYLKITLIWSMLGASHISLVGLYNMNIGLLAK